jgi:predicted O-methyltransferase YrrM
MSEETWIAVDRYLEGVLIGPDATLEGVLKQSARAGLPPISVSAAQGKLLHLLARVRGARNILEVGTLGGYSTIWMARALPDNGRLISLEIDPHHAEVARANIEWAGLSGRIEVRLGAALDSLARLEAERAGPFDLSFIDADKANNPSYFKSALRLSRPGSLIVVDNVIRDGAVIYAHSTDPSVRGVRKLNELIAGEPRVSATAIQTVGVKGYDGFTLALVLEV